MLSCAQALSASKKKGIAETIPFDFYNAERLFVLHAAYAVTVELDAWVLVPHVAIAVGHVATGFGLIGGIG